MSEYQAEIAAGIRAALPGAKAAAWPSPAFQHMGARILDYVPGEFVVCAFPAREEYAGVDGHVAPAYLLAAMELTLMPLALLAAKRPADPITFNVSFTRSFPAAGAEFHAEARIRALTKSILFFETKATAPDGKSAAHATATLLAG